MATKKFLEAFGGENFQQILPTPDPAKLAKEDAKAHRAGGALSRPKERIPPDTTFEALVDIHLAAGDITSTDRDKILETYRETMSSNEFPELFEGAPVYNKMLEFCKTNHLSREEQDVLLSTARTLYESILKKHEDFPTYTEFEATLLHILTGKRRDKHINDIGQALLFDLLQEEIKKYLNLNPDTQPVDTVQHTPVTEKHHDAVGDSDASAVIAVESETYRQAVYDESHTREEQTRPVPENTQSNAITAEHLNTTAPSPPSLLAGASVIVDKNYEDEINRQGAHITYPTKKRTVRQRLGSLARAAGVLLASTGLFGEKNAHQQADATASPLESAGAQIQHIGTEQLKRLQETTPTETREHSVDLPIRSTVDAQPETHEPANAETHTPQEQERSEITISVEAKPGDGLYSLMRAAIAQLPEDRKRRILEQTYKELYHISDAGDVFVPKMDNKTLIGRINTRIHYATLPGAEVYPEDVMKLSVNAQDHITVSLKPKTTSPRQQPPSSRQQPATPNRKGTTDKKPENTAPPRKTGIGSVQPTRESQHERPTTAPQRETSDNTITTAERNLINQQVPYTSASGKTSTKILVDIRFTEEGNKKYIYSNPNGSGRFASPMPPDSLR